MQNALDDDIRRVTSQYEISLRLHTVFAGDQTITALPHALLGDVLAEKLGPGRYKVFQGGYPLPLTESLSTLDLDDDCRLDIHKNNKPLTDATICVAVRKYCRSPESRAKVVAEYGEIGDWDVAAVTRMRSLFEGQRSFNEDISGWDTRNVTTMRFMFFNAEAFNQPVEGWCTTSVVDMRSMFHNARAFNQPVEQWSTAGVTTMQAMFNGAAAFNQPVEQWCTANVTSMRTMFYGAEAFNQPVEQWCTASVTDMGFMFHGAAAFNQPPGWLRA